MVHRRHFRTAFEELERVHRVMLSGCVCSAQDPETSVRGIGMLLSAELQQEQETESGQYSKWDRGHRPYSHLRLQMDFGGVQGTTPREGVACLLQ
jgi:hypothetical protein